MLEKSNRTGLLVDRQKALLTSRLKASLFHGFSTARETVKFQKISPEFREISAILKIFGIPGIRKIPGKFSPEIFSSLIILTFFLIFSISNEPFFTFCFLTPEFVDVSKQNFIFE